jgi:hypothetical protein
MVMMDSGLQLKPTLGRDKLTLFVVCYFVCQYVDRVGAFYPTDNGTQTTDVLVDILALGDVASDDSDSFSGGDLYGVYLEPGDTLEVHMNRRGLALRANLTQRRLLSCAWNSTDEEAGDPLQDRVILTNVAIANSSFVDIRMTVIPGSDSRHRLISDHPCDLFVGGQCWKTGCPTCLFQSFGCSDDAGCTNWSVGQAWASSSIPLDKRKSFSTTCQAAWRPSALKYTLKTAMTEIYSTTYQTGWGVRYTVRMHVECKVGVPDFADDDA